jgi:hypothetical protein
MLHKKAKKTGKEAGDALRASVKKEMAEPRMAKSARTMERTLGMNRIPVRRNTTMPGTADKIIPSRSRRQPEEAQIRVDQAARRHRDLLIENSLTDEHGHEVKLKKDARVDVTIAVEPKTDIAKTKKEN